MTVLEEGKTHTESTDNETQTCDCDIKEKFRSVKKTVSIGSEVGLTSFSLTCLATPASGFVPLAQCRT